MNKNKPKLLRDMDKPEVFGYELDRTTLLIVRKTLPALKPGQDNGADPLGNGMFRMHPSGDIVDLQERNKRLNQ